MGKSQKTITVTIDKQGGTKIEAAGFTGNSCLKETEDLEEALGKVSDRHMTAEASKPVQVTYKSKMNI